jgi:membrane AbrB-like protein
VRDPLRRTALVLATFAAACGVGEILRLAGAPVAYLFGGLLTGIAVALARPGRVDVPSWSYTAAQALLGAAIGSVARRGITGSPSLLAALPLVVVVTIGLSLAAGIVLARRAHLGRETALLGMVAGGSAAVVAAADDPGVHADARIVAVLQYLRVGLVALTAPLLAAALYHGAGTRSPRPDPSELIDHLQSSTTLIVLSLAGVWLGRTVRLPAAALAGPLVLATAVGWTGLLPDAPVPSVAVTVGLAIIGLEIGLRFDWVTLRSLGPMAPSIAATSMALIVGCALVGWLLSRATGITLVEGYLMTTPGGINAVMGTAVGFPHVDVALVTLAQIVRLLAMVIVMPMLVRRLVGAQRVRR